MDGASNNAKIAIVLPYLKSRGTEMQSLRLARGFIERGARVVLFVVQGWGADSMYEKFSHLGAKVVDVGPPVDVGEKKVRTGRFAALARLVRDERCDALLSRAGMTNPIAALAGLIACVPVVTVFSGPVQKTDADRPLPRRVISRLRRHVIYGLASRIVTVSGESASNFRNRYPLLASRVTAIPNGIDVTQVRNSPPTEFSVDPGRFNLCFCGSLEIQRKGLDVLINALRSLVFNHKLHQLQLVLVGTGQDESSLRAMVRQAALENYVVFAGEHNPPFSLIRQCDAFVLPSRREGFPNSLLEAMALGLCPIAADCNTGPREIICDRKNGLLVPVGESQPLVEAIRRIVREGTFRERMASQARKTVEDEFSARRMVDSYSSILGINDE